MSLTWFEGLMVAAATANLAMLWLISRYLKSILRLLQKK
jgi:hypothetical protein